MTIAYVVYQDCLPPGFAAEVLVELTRDPQTRLTAARSLIQLGPDHVGPAVAVLRQELSQGQPSRRPAAANLLGQIGPKASAAIPELTALLNSPSETGVMQAAEALGRNDVGVIQVGAYGDLVAVDGDPLTNVRLLEKPAAVIKGGTLIPHK